MAMNKLQNMFEIFNMFRKVTADGIEYAKRSQVDILISIVHFGHLTWDQHTAGKY